MKKTIISLMLALTVMCGIVGAAQAMPSDHDLTYYYVNTSNRGALNLRQTASNAAKVLVQIPYAAQVELADYVAGDKWAHCYYGGTEGYVMVRYLSKTRPSTGTTTTTTTVGSESAEYKRMEPAYYYAVVHPSTPTGYVHMRWAPSKTEPVFRDYYDGQVLKVLYQNSSWCQVLDESNQVCGYMMRAFLTYAGEAGAYSETLQPIK